MAAAAAASHRLLDPPRRLRQSSGSQLPRRTRASQRMVGALGAFGSGSAGGRAPPKRRLIPIPPALMSRLSMTLLLVWIARLGHFIPVPGVAWTQAGGASAVQQLMGRTEVAANLFILSISPLMTAYFLLSVLQIFPPIRQYFTALREEGTKGQEVFNTYVTGAFCFFAVLEAYSLACKWAEQLHLQSLARHLVDQMAASAAAAAAEVAALADPAAAAAAAAAAGAAAATAASAGAAAAGAPAAAAAAGSAAATAAAAGAAAGGMSSGGPGFIFYAVAVLVAGATICKTISQTVEQRGLGDGASLLIATGVAVNYAQYLGEAAKALALSQPALPALLLVGAMCAGLSAATLWMQSVQLWVPLAFYRTEPNRVATSAHPLDELLAQPPKQGWREPNLRPGPKAPILGVEGEGEGEGSGTGGWGGGGAAGHRFPLRLSPSGARSLLFANFWTAMLSMPLSWLGLGNPFESALPFALLVFCVEGITVADVTPRQMSQYLQNSDGGIPNLSPGDPTLRYFAQRRQQLKLLNAALLAALSLAARAVDAASTALIGVPAGCLSLLLLVSTAALGTRQVEALTRAPIVEELAARQQAPALAGGTRTAFPGPEAWW